MSCRDPGLGAIPIAATIAAGIINYIIGSRISASQAAAQVAAQYDNFRQVSDAQLAQASFELANALPQYPYWQWFRLLESMRSYGAIPPPGQTPTVPITQVVDGPVQAGIGGAWYMWLLAGLATFVAYQIVD